MNTQIAFKLALSNYLGDFEASRYEFVALTIDCLFHVSRGFKVGAIDYLKLAMYHRKLMAETMGVKKSSKDDGLMDHTKDAGNRQSDHTRFTYHNVEYHLLLDHDIWSNLTLARCKTNEKTNKNTKDALRKGQIGENLCNRIMWYRKKQLVFTYLIEGNGVNDDGVMDPINGKNKLSAEILNGLPDIKWFSVFADRKRNPTKPEYTQGYQPEAKIKAMKSSIYSEIEFDLDQMLYEQFEDMVESCIFYKRCYYWRKMKRNLISSSSLIVNDQKDLLLVTGLATVTTMADESYTIAIGHGVDLDVYYDGIDRSLKGSIDAKKFICWKICDVYANAIYGHFCDPNNSFGCSVRADVIQHDWKDNNRIVVFWYLGMGKRKCLGNPLVDFDPNHEYYHPAN